MRSITESITRIRIYLRDKNAKTFSAELIESFISEAMARIGDRIVNEEHVADQLRAVGPVMAMNQLQQDYPLPDDCKEPDFIEMRLSDVPYSILTGDATETDPLEWENVEDGSFGLFVDDRLIYVYGVDLSALGTPTMADIAAELQRLFRAVSNGTETIEWSTDHFVIHGYTSVGYAVPAPQPGRGTDLSGTGWLAASASTGSITFANPQWDWVSIERAYPKNQTEFFVASVSTVYPPQGGNGASFGMWWHPASSPGYVHLWPQPYVNNLLIRFRYKRAPVMPPSNAQGWPYFPDGFDTLIEYYVAAEMGYQELQDSKPMQDYAAMFEAKYQSYVSGWRRRDMPDRNYVQIVNAGPSWLTS